MNIEEFYHEIVKLVPVKRKGCYEDCFDALRLTFHSYINLINQLNYKKISGYATEIKFICDCIIDIIDEYDKGLYLSARQKLETLLNGEKVLDKLAVYVYSDGYRARADLDSKETDIPCICQFFHVPFDERGKISTNRFSSPGYPCLYLAGSVYSSWIELNDPANKENKLFWVSKLSAPLPLLDLSIPDEDWFNDRIDVLLFTFPFTISCIIPVIDRKANYKPEYIMPQLLMEFIIYNFQKDNVDIGKNILLPNEYFQRELSGIYYSSSIADGDCFDSRLKNAVMPAFQIDRNCKYSQYLCKRVEISNPVYWDGSFEKEIGLRKILDELEGRLDNEEYHSLSSISPK
jgi:hypothetical protein